MPRFRLPEYERSAGVPARGWDVWGSRAVSISTDVCDGFTVSGRIGSSFSAVDARKGGVQGPTGNRPVGRDRAGGRSCAEEPERGEGVGETAGLFRPGEFVIKIVR